MDYKYGQIGIRLSMDDYPIRPIISSLPYSICYHWSLWTCKTGRSIFFLEPYSQIIIFIYSILSTFYLSSIVFQKQNIIELRELYSFDRQEGRAFHGWTPGIRWGWKVDMAIMTLRFCFDQEQHLQTSNLLSIRYNCSYIHSVTRLHVYRRTDTVETLCFIQKPEIKIIIHNTYTG